MMPASEDELAQAVRDASGPLAISGGGTRPLGRPVVGEALSLRAMTGIALYDPGALTLVVRTGTPVEEITAALKAENQRLPFEPMDHRALMGREGTPTIGGVVAANVSGPRRIAVGACRDFLLGVRFVDGQGRIVKNGGRVMKNVTGYDLVKLMAGAQGTLGVLTEVAMKVLPDVATEATLSISDLAPDRAVAAMSAALGSPYEVTGAAHDTTHGTVLRIEGFGESVRYRAAALVKHLAAFGAIDSVTGADSRAIWAVIRDRTDFAAAHGDVWRFSVKPGDAPLLIDRLAAQQVAMDWGGGLVWAHCPPGTDLRARMGDVAGHATLVRASAETRAAIAPFHPEPAPLRAIADGLRARFDPRGILNPGLMT